MEAGAGIRADNNGPVSVCGGYRGSIHDQICLFFLNFFLANDVLFGYEIRIYTAELKT